MFKNENAYLHIGKTKVRMKLLVNCMSGFTLLLFGAYVVLTGQTIYNVVNEKNIEREITLSRSNIANLENDLFSQYNSISEQTLLAQGFVKYNNEVYVSNGLSFALNQ
jgi:uncharacterized protein YabE (DUF348 family)